MKHFQVVFILLFMAFALFIAGLSAAPPINMQTKANAQRLGWTVVSCPVTTTLRSVDMVSSTLGWAVGGSAMLRYDGNSWTQVTLPVEPAKFYAVSASSADSGWATGYAWGYNFMLKWDGNAWQTLGVPNEWGIRLISAPNPTSAWVAGGMYVFMNPDDFPDEAFNWIYYRSGETWHETSGPPHVFLTSLFMLNDADGWAAGTEVLTTTQQLRSMIIRWNGSTWTNINHPWLEGTVSEERDFLQGISALNTAYAWAVGKTPDLKGATLQWDGSNWTQVSNPAQDILFSVAIVSANDVWAVGGGGTILHWDGNIWSKVTSPVTTTLRSISMVSADDGWAVGDGGVILHYGPIFPIYLPLVLK